MGERTCSVDGCDDPHLARGWCRTHYQRWRKHGDPLAPSPRGSRVGHCDVSGCSEAIRAKRLCNRHYKVREYWTKRDAAPPTQGTCAQCGGSFDQPKDRRPLTYCTPRCRDLASFARDRAERRTGRPVHCSWCGGSLVGKRSDAKYCSDYCSNRADLRDNRERIYVQQREYAAANPEKVRAAELQYRDRNREQIYARQRAWQDANRERYQKYHREYARQYALRKPEKLRLHTANRVGRKRDNGGGALRISARDWHRMLVVYRHRCAYCGSRGGGVALQLEHVVPLSRGGRHALGNVVPACRPCNSSKGDRLLVEWRNNISRRRKPRTIA